MIYFLQVSDTHHLENQRENRDCFCHSLDSMEVLQRKLEILAKKVQKPLDFICHCGDVCHHGTKYDYQAVKMAFQQYFPEVPLILTVGNHDNFKEMSQVFGVKQQSFHCYSRKIGELLVISLNNSNEGNGAITSAQCEMLREELKKNQGIPTILLTHHHLIASQSPMEMAKIISQFSGILQQNPFLALLTGHTHYHFQGTFAEIPYFAVDSMSFQGTDSGKGYLQMKESSGYHLFSYEQGKINLELRGNLGFEKDLGRAYFQEKQIKLPHSQ